MADSLDLGGDIILPTLEVWSVEQRTPLTIRKGTKTG